MSGIPPSVWEAEGDRTIATALELIAEKGSGSGDDDDMVMSG